MTDLIGCNVNIRYGFTTAAAHAVSRGATAFQIFLKAPHSFKRLRQKPEDIIKLKKDIDKHNLQLVVHGSFLMNFCRSPKHYVHHKSIPILIDDMIDAEKLGAKGVIVHMGKAIDLPKEKALKNYIAGLTSCLEKCPIGNIILETGAGVGTEVGTYLPSLGWLRKKIPKEHRHRIGFCLDTCHLFSAGYDLGDPEYVDIVLKEVELHLGWENVWCIHLNDSYRPLDCHSDNHADLGRGHINLHGLRKFVNACVKKGIMVVLETPTDWLDRNGKPIKIKGKKNTFDPKDYPGASRYDYKDQIRLIRHWVSHPNDSPYFLPSEKKEKK